MSRARVVAGIAAVAAVFASVAVVAEAIGPATVIVNASIVDGTGSPAHKGAVRIAGERIVAVGEFSPEARRTRRRCRRADTDAGIHRYAQPS